MNLTKICSAPSIERLEKLINQYHYSTTFIIKDDKVYNSKGLFESGVIQKKGNKFYYLIKS